MRLIRGAKAACSVHGSASRWRKRVEFIRLSCTEAGIHSAESRWAKAQLVIEFVEILRPLSVYGNDRLKSLLFFILAPGIVAGFIPLALLRTGSKIQTGFLSYLAFPLWLIGVATLLWCFWDFLVKGRGTPAPIDPPKELVVSGLYNYVRNPMYVGVLLVIIGHFLWFGFWGLLIYAIIVFIAFNTFVTFYEEPNLKKRFGAAYEDYLRRVPRWIPKL